MSVPRVAGGLRRSLKPAFLCLPLLFAFATPAAAQQMGFVKRGASIDEATQYGRNGGKIRMEVAGNPASLLASPEGAVLGLQIVASKSTATPGVDYDMSSSNCTVGVGSICRIPFTVRYTDNCELDETVVIRMTSFNLNGEPYDIDPARNEFTITILEALDDSARIPGNYSGSRYARERCTADGVDWRQNNTPLSHGRDSKSQDSDPGHDGNVQQLADYSELRARVRTWAGQTQHGAAHVTRWMRVLAAFGEQDAIQQGYTAMTAAEAQQMADAFTASRWNPIVEALTDLESRVTAQADSEPEPEPVACVSEELEDDVEDYSEETHHGAAHVERWLRVLQTFRGTANDATVVTAAEAQQMADDFSAGRWNPVVAAIQCLEEQALRQAMSN